MIKYFLVENNKTPTSAGFDEFVVWDGQAAVVFFDALSGAT